MEDFNTSGFQKPSF